MKPRLDWRADDGNVVVELAPIAAVLILFLAMAIGAGRMMIAQGAVQAAARDAARQASIARTPGQAQAAAVQSAQAALRHDGLDCDPQVTVDTSGFAVPVGQPAQVSVQVSYDVRLSGLTLVPGMPGSKMLTASYVSALDPYRAR